MNKSWTRFKESLISKPEHFILFMFFYVSVFILHHNYLRSCLHDTSLCSLTENHIEIIRVFFFLERYASLSQIPLNFLFLFSFGLLLYTSEFYSKKSGSHTKKGIWKIQKNLKFQNGRNSLLINFHVFHIG